jgi:hypothetical protein
MKPRVAAELAIVGIAHRAVTSRKAPTWSEHVLSFDFCLQWLLSGLR